MEWPLGCLIGPLIGLGLLGGNLSLAPAQQGDTVLVRRNDAQEPLKRHGTITEWKGNSLTLTTPTRERTIDNSSIVEVITSWQPSYQEAQHDLRRGDLPAAIEKLKTAIDAEPRPWARRVYRADLVRAYQGIEAREAAIGQFLAIISEDPQTRFFHLCPLCWMPDQHPPPQAIRALIDSEQPIEQLLAASWMLTGTDRERAIKVLETLAEDIDTNIQHAATVQLWRLRRFNASPRQIQVWEKQMETMPPSVRPGAWFTIAQAQRAASLPEEGAINLMRIPILYPEQIELSAAALFQTGQWLHQRGQHREAQTVWNELRRKYGSTLWAHQIPDAASRPHPTPLVPK